MPKSSRIQMVLGGALAVSVLAAANLAGLGSNNAVAFQDMSKAQIEKIVHDYLMANPQVILEAVDQYASQQRDAADEAAKEAARENLPLLMSGASGHAMGADVDEAEVILVEFFDYNCGVCKRAADFVFDEADKNKKMRVVFQELPVVHAKSWDVSVASLAIAGSEDYVPLHRELLRAPGVVTIDNLPQIASKIGIEPTKLTNALSNDNDRENLEATLNMSMQLAEEMGLGGTPAFIVASPNGEYVEIVPGFSPVDIRNAIKAAKQKSS